MKLNTNISTLRLGILLFSSAILFAVTLAFVGNWLSNDDNIVTENFGTSNTLKIEWQSSYEKALALAKRENKPVFIDFTGWTCTNCRWMEANIFELPEIKLMLSGMVPVRLYTDRRQEPELSNKKLENEKYNSNELPLYLILSSDGKELARKNFTRNLEEFLFFLNKANS